METEKKLTIIDSSGNMQEISLTAFGQNKLYMGRDPKNAIQLHDSFVSGTHGCFKLNGGTVLYADLGSSNGTYAEKDGYRYFLRGNRTYYELQSGAMLRIQMNEKDTSRSVLILYTCDDSDGKWTHYPLIASTVTIGREPGSNIVLDSPAVSRRHAQVVRKGDTYTIVDAGSKHGIVVNGHFVRGQQQLAEKSVIQIVNHTLVFSGGSLYYRNSAQGVTLEFRHVNKVVDRGKKILNDVNGVIESNAFVAIVGGSGAGKTTLMNAISGFDRAVTGEICFNGINVHEHFDDLKELIGYVPQEDIIYQNLTLQRMLYYTARLKMPPDTSRKEMDRRIAQVLDMVELSAHKDTYIRKLSGGQKKRASIAVELLADPSLFFLDEPTSGLDPGTEQKLMMTLNTLSKSQGKTIVMVTHTTQSLELCDKVIFMGRGGRLCFAGTTTQARMFFNTDNLVDIYNMITDEPEQWEEQYKRSTPLAPIIRDKQETAVKKTGKGVGLSQLGVLIRRYMELIVNDLQRLLLLFAQPILIALLLAVVANERTFFTYDDTKAILFALSCAGIWIGLFNSIQEVCKERPILKREYMGNLKLPFYILSKFVVQTLLGGLQGILMLAIFALLVGLPSEGILFSGAFPEMLLTLWLTIEAAMAIGLVISSLVRNGDRAMSMAPFVLIIQLLFSGILFELSGAGKVIAWFTISKWSVEGLGSIAVMNDLPNLMQRKMPAAVTVDEIFLSTAAHLGKDWGILMLMAVFCAVACCVLLRSLSRDSR